MGPLITQLLRQRKYFVKGIDVNYFSDNENIISYKKKNYLPNIQIFRDIRKLQNEDLKGFDKIVILAALSNDPLGQLNKDITKSININATKNLIAKCYKLNFKKIIFASSCSVYGFPKNKKDIVKETYRINPLTEYAKSKIKIENYAKTKRARSTKFVSLRFGTACGISPNMRFDIVLNNMFAHSKIEDKIKIFSDGTPWRPMIDVEDMSKLIYFFLSTKKKLKDYNVFNAGSNKCDYTVLDLAKKIKKFVPKSNILIYNKNVNDKRSYKVNFKKINNFLGKNYKFKSIDLSCSDLNKWFNRAKIKKISKIYSKKYIRLKKINDLILRKKVNKKLEFI